MNDDNLTEEELTRYLFGEMTEEEQTQLEASYFADPRKFAELCAWRDHLIDRYVGDELSPAVRKRFEVGIENAWAVNERVRFAETLQQAIDARGDKSDRSADGLSPQTFRLFLVRHRRDLFILAVVALLAVIVFLLISRL